MTTTKKSKDKSIPAQIEEFGKAAGKQVRETLERLAEPPRKAVADIQTDLTKRGRELRKRADETLRGLRSDAAKQRREVEKRARKTVGEVRDRAEALARDVRRQVEEVVGPLATRLDVASRSDIETLRKRIDRIERRVGEIAHAPQTHS